MKRYLSVLLVLAFVLASAASASDVPAERIRAYISQLESKLEEARGENDEERVGRLKQLIAEQYGRLSMPAPVAASGGDAQETKEMVEDAREDMNKAIAELKGQLDAVKKDNSDARVSGLIRTAWTKGLDKAASTPNRFDVSRAYLTFRKRLDRGAAARITLDVDRISAAGSSRQNLFDYIKYAYVDLPVPMAGLPVTLTGIMGLQHTPWIDWAGKIWGHEDVRSAFADVHKNSISSSADFGLGAKGKISLPAVPDIDYHATLLNGAGYRSGENNTGKDLALRMNSDILKMDAGTVVLGAYAGKKNALFNASASEETTQAGFLLGLKNSTYGNVYFEYQTDTRSKKDRNGYSVGGFLYPMPELLPGAGLLARYDSFDEDVNAADQTINTTVIGAFYKWGRNVKIGLDLTSVKAKKADEVRTAALRSEISF